MRFLIPYYSFQYIIPCFCGRINDHPDDGGSKHLWNVCNLLPDYSEQQPRRLPPSSMEMRLKDFYKLVLDEGKWLAWRWLLPPAAVTASGQPVLRKSLHALHSTRHTKHGKHAARGPHAVLFHALCGSTREAKVTGTPPFSSYLRTISDVRFEGAQACVYTRQKLSDVSYRE
jgi:hypothetical protein